MLKKIALFLTSIFLIASQAYAVVEVNSADQAALDSITGVGPATSKAILDERKKGGNFKDWSDLEGRVKGVGAKNAVKLSAAGLVVNGQTHPGASAAKPKKTQSSNDMTKSEPAKGEPKEK
jgi:competence protein ComEA